MWFDLPHLPKIPQQTLPTTKAAHAGELREQLYGNSPQDVATYDDIRRLINEVLL